MTYDWQFWLVVLTELLAIAYLAGKFGLVRRPRIASKPDVKASSLVRKKPSSARGQSE